jgi:hypothetical protein
VTQPRARSYVRCSGKRAEEGGCQNRVMGASEQGWGMGNKGYLKVLVDFDLRSWPIKQGL